MAALTLAQAGLKVRLHEAREIAGGASGRNGGFALRGGAAPYDVTIETIGREQAARYWRLTEEALDKLAALAGDACRRTGSLRLADDDEERDALAVEYEALRADGFAADWVEEPLDGRFRAAIFHPADAALQPARWVRRLAALAADAGAEIREHDRVQSLEELDAEQVLVATDGYLSGLLGQLEGLIVPTRGQMIATEPIGERLFDCPHYGRHGFDYWQQTPDGRMLAGGFRDSALQDEFTSEEVTTAGIQDALETFVASLVGRPLRVDYRWAGLFGLVMDFLPVVGRVPGEERVWVAGGYSGHGNVLGLLCGDLAAQAMLGRERPSLPGWIPRGFFSPRRRERSRRPGRARTSCPRCPGSERTSRSAGSAASRRPCRPPRAIFARVASISVRRHVDDRAALALLRRVDRADGLFSLGHQVRERCVAALEAPAEDALPEALGAVDVAGGQFEVNDGCHAAESSACPDTRVRWGLKTRRERAPRSTVWATSRRGRSLAGHPYGCGVSKRVREPARDRCAAARGVDPNDTRDRSAAGVAPPTR